MKNSRVLAAFGVVAILSAPALADQTNGFGVATSAVTGDFFTFSSAGSAYRTGQDSSFVYSRIGDVAPAQFVQGCEREIELGSVCSGAFSGTTGPGFNQTASSNSASLANGLRADLPGILRSNASARADLATGQLGVEAISDYRHSTYGIAQFNDTLDFTIIGATAATITNITVQFILDGTLDPGSAHIENRLNFGNANAFLAYNLGNGGDPIIQRQAGWASFNWDRSIPAQTTFTGVYALTGASQSIGLFEQLRGEAQSGGRALFGHTSALSLSLPTNVTFTSASGTFLTGGATPGGVPEPASWAMLLAGFGLVGSAMRRRAPAQRMVAA